MKPLVGFDSDVAAFVGELIPHVAGIGFPDEAVTVGAIDDGGSLCGGFVFSNYEPRAGIIELSAAGTDPRWMSRPVIWAAFNYVFNQLGCQMVFTRTAATNTRALRINKAYGFKFVTVPRLMGRDCDAVIGTLTVEDWRRNGFHKENSNG